MGELATVLKAEGDLGLEVGIECFAHHRATQVAGEITATDKHDGVIGRVPGSPAGPLDDTGPGALLKSDLGSDAGAEEALLQVRPVRQSLQAHQSASIVG